MDHQVPVRIRNRDQFFHCVLIYAIISTNCSCFLFLFFINTTFSLVYMTTTTTMTPFQYTLYSFHHHPLYSVRIIILKNIFLSYWNFAQKVRKSLRFFNDEYVFALLKNIDQNIHLLYVVLQDHTSKNHTKFII